MLIFAALVIGALLLFFLPGHGGGTVAVISVDGEEIERIDLSKVRETREMIISTEYGSNTVRIEPGAISVTEADCPDHICVRQGKISAEGIPIICMPHRLIICIEGDELDG